jgi:hypothetical protein
MVHGELGAGEFLPAVVAEALGENMLPPLGALKLLGFFTLAGDMSFVVGEIVPVVRHSLPFGDYSI